MNKGQFCFIIDEFYLKYDKEQKLMQNKETVDGASHSRPCFFAFTDNKNPDIFWCVPISSKTEKYQIIYNKKIENQRQRGIAHPKCNTIRFGYVLGRKRAFLIQNMFPLSDKYISSLYMDNNTGNPVTVPPETEKDIIKNASDVQRLVFHGHNNIVFADIVTMYSNLCKEIEQNHLRQSDRAYVDDRLIKALDEVELNKDQEDIHMNRYFTQY